MNKDLNIKEITNAVSLDLLQKSVSKYEAQSILQNIYCNCNYMYSSDGAKAFKSPKFVELDGVYTPNLLTKIDGQFPSVENWFNSAIEDKPIATFNLELNNEQLKIIIDAIKGLITNTKTQKIGLKFYANDNQLVFNSKYKFLNDDCISTFIMPVKFESYNSGDDNLEIFLNKEYLNLVFESCYKTKLTKYQKTIPFKFEFEYRGLLKPLITKVSFLDKEIGTYLLMPIQPR